VMVAVLPFILLATLFIVGVAFVAVMFALAAPLLPFAVIGLLIWAAMRASRPALSA
jgi:hypothetical protein